MRKIKIQKFIAPELMIVETSGWRHLKEKNKLFLSYEYKKMYHPTPKTTPISKIAPNRKWKTLFLPYVSKNRTTYFDFLLTILKKMSWLMKFHLRMHRNLNTDGYSWKADCRCDNDPRKTTEARLLSFLLINMLNVISV